MVAPTAAPQPAILRTPPPFSRDRLVHTWLAVKALSDAGDAVWTIAVAWTAVQIASPAIAGLVVAAGTIPRALVLLLGGAIADRTDARRVMILVNALRTAVLLVAALWALSAAPTVAMLLVATIAFGVCDAFFEPSAGTIPRRLVRPADLPDYSALGQTLSRLGTLAGSAAGGFLVAASDLGGSASANAVAYVVVIAFLALWLKPRFVLPRAAGAGSVLHDVAAGFRHLRENPSTRILVIALSGLNLASGPAGAIGIALQATAQGWGAGAVGLFEAMIGGGAMIGSVVVLRWRPRREALAGFRALVVQGIAVILLGIGSPWAVGAGCLLIGLTAGFASVLLSATFAGTVAPDHLGRMSSITRLGDDCLMPLTMAAFGALAGVAPLWVPFAVYGAAMAVLVSMPLFRPFFQTLSLREDPSAPERDDVRDESTSAG